MAKNESSGGRALRFLVGAAAFVIVVAGLREAATIVVPFLVSLFVAILCGPWIFWLQRKGLPQWLSMLLVVAAIMGAGLGIAALLGNSLAEFTLALPDYQERLRELTASTLVWLEAQGFPVNRSTLQGFANPADIMGLLGRLFTGLGSLVTNAFLILLTVVFMLIEASGFSSKLRSAVGHSQSLALPDFGKFAASIQDYLVIKTWMSLATGASAALLAAVLGVDFAILWGLLAFLLNYVPNIGSIIAAVPPVLLAMVQYGVQRALLVAIGYIVINMVFGNILEPRMLGRGMGLSTLVVFLSLVFWGWVLGAVGLLLAIPLTMAAKILLEMSEDTCWLAILLGPPPSEPEQKPRDGNSPAAANS